MTDTTTAAEPEFAPVDPFALQQNETVRVCTAEGDGTCLQGVVALVDTKNLYVSVIFDGTQYPVALPMPDWVFQTEVDVRVVPTEPGLYIDDEAEDQEHATIYRLRDEVWTNVDTGETVEIDDLPNLAPLRAHSPTSQNFQSGSEYQRPKDETTITDTAGDPT